MLVHCLGLWGLVEKTLGPPKSKTGRWALLTLLTIDARYLFSQQVRLSYEDLSITILV